ncbi:hypothetical protein LBMAG56_35290 [Verrucomicrobiota bacterium]|nr:hypothetical protein LBMAG56_35290 [Verrucomicrobiota bacterium]
MKNNIVSTGQAPETFVMPATASPTPASTAAPDRGRVPLGVKLAYTAFMAVLVPVYWKNYGPTNFLYFCDVALFVTLVAVWSENALLASAAAVGIVLPQLLWCADFAAGLLGFRLTGMTAYMFDTKRPLFLRGLSLFHGWLPFLLVFLVKRLGYDRRALPVWTATAWALLLICFNFLPPAGAALADPRTPINVNYVWGMSDEAPQTWLPTYAWLALLFTGLPLLIFLPTHCVLRKIFPRSDTHSPAE